MADVNWKIMLAHALVEVLASHDFDHNPLLLSCKKAQSSKVKCFHFQAVWLTHPDYNKLVENTCNSSIGDVPVKLGKIKDQSLIFNRDIFGNIFRQKKKIP